MSPVTGLLPFTPTDDSPGGVPPAVKRLLAVVARHDSYSAAHSVRVARHAALAGSVMGLARDEVGVLTQAGMLHDVGKMGIPGRLLKKTGPLTKQEFALVRQHPGYGASLLSRLPSLKDLIPMVYHHHERWDGRGYPAGLAGHDIPLGARIILVADAFDAMTSDRPYARALGREEALAELQRCSGRQFDPVVVEVIREAWDAAIGHDDLLVAVQR